MSNAATPQGDPGRRLAHERLSTGGLARWMRACATHPWRVVGAWGGIIVVLIVLVSAFGGGLRTSSRSRARTPSGQPTSSRRSSPSEQGAVLNLVFAAPEGQRLDTPERKAAIESAIAKLKTGEFKPTGRHGRHRSVGDPFSKDTFSDDGRIAYAEAQFSETIETEDRDQVVAVEDSVRDTWRRPA